jgi:hypothetical protein
LPTVSEDVVQHRPFVVALGDRNDLEPALRDRRRAALAGASAIESAKARVSMAFSSSVVMAGDLARLAGV